MASSTNPIPKKEFIAIITASYNICKQCRRYDSEREGCNSLYPPCTLKDNLLINPDFACPWRNFKSANEQYSERTKTGDNQS